MKLGYQGEENCYSYQVIKKYLDNNIYNKGYNSFELVFEALHNEEIDFLTSKLSDSNFNLFNLIE